MRTIKCQNQIISYNLIRKDVKNINLRIKSDLSISVSANNTIKDETIDNFVLSKADYILKVLDKFKERKNPPTKPKKYVSGESFNILGNNVRLKVTCGKYELVSYDGIYLLLQTKNLNDSTKKEKQIKKWYKDQTKVVFLEISKKVHENFIKHNVSFPQVRIREMSSRWGSCSYQKGIITLNSKLFETPRICIEYVVMHEFCHFLIPNHSKSFYTLLGTMMPDWKERKEILETGNYLS